MCHYYYLSARYTILLFVSYVFAAFDFFDTLYNLLLLISTDSYNIYVSWNQVFFQLLNAINAIRVDLLIFKRFARNAHKNVIHLLDFLYAIKNLTIIISTETINLSPLII